MPSRAAARANRMTPRSAWRRPAPPGPRERFSPKNTMSGFIVPPQAGQSGAAKSEKSMWSVSASGRLGWAHSRSRRQWMSITALLPAACCSQRTFRVSSICGSIGHVAVMPTSRGKLGLCRRDHSNERDTYCGARRSFNWQNGIAIVEAIKLRPGDKVRVFWTWRGQSPAVSCSDAL